MLAPVIDTLPYDESWIRPAISHHENLRLIHTGNVQNQASLFCLKNLVLIFPLSLKPGFIFHLETTLSLSVVKFYRQGQTKATAMST